jgi:hypothetical protein
MQGSSNTHERRRIEPEADGTDKHPLSAADSLRLHWPEYLMEAGESGLYLFACHLPLCYGIPVRPFSHSCRATLFAALLMGLAMGATTLAIVLSPWGKQSGARFFLPVAVDSLESKQRPFCFLLAFTGFREERRDAAVQSELHSEAGILIHYLCAHLSGVL